MSWFKLKQPVGTNYRLDVGDLTNTKRALNQLGYYDIPPHRGIDDWTDDALFDGIRRFQKDNGLTGCGKTPIWRLRPLFVMRGLDPRIHAAPPNHLSLWDSCGNAWMAGSSPAMTNGAE